MPLAHETLSPGEAVLTAEFIDFLRNASAARYPSGVMRRFNQSRHAGCVDAEFTVLPGLPEELRVGLFAQSRTCRAWVRFASAASTSDRERDVRGMSISVKGVPGANLTPGISSQDFVLNSHPVMMASGVTEFLALLRANEAGGFQRAWYFLTHPKAARVALASRQHHTSHLEIPYWSTTPYLFGEGRAVKYVVRPSSAHKSILPAQLTDNYLRDRLRSHLASSEASFDFMVQFQVDERRTPIEDASVEWPAEVSPYRGVARIRIPPQDIDSPGRMESCERTAFNPWHALAEHRPLGGMNRARREIYSALARFREERRSGSQPPGGA
jgi:hypothetical protein